MLDAIVLGLGAAGSATLYQLAKRGAAVLGVDRHAPPHALGSSHGDTRLTRLAIGEGEGYTPLALRSHAIWREIERETGAALLSVTGGLIISSAAQRSRSHVAGFFANTLAAARKHGIEHERLDAAGIRARFPQFAVRDDERGYFEPGAGFLRPEACIAAQLGLAEKHGAAIRRNEAVRDYHEEGGGVRVETDRGEYRARRLVIAAGPWLPGLLEPELARLFTVSRQVLHWFGVRGPAGRFDPGRFPVFIWELQGRSQPVYGFPAIDGPGGGVKLATEQHTRATTPDDVDREVPPEESRAMFEELVAPFFPDLSPQRVKAVSCLYTATPDFHFVVDRHPRMGAAIVASPCSGHGFKHSAAIGEAIAELVLEGASRIDLGGFRLDRFAPRV